MTNSSHADRSKDRPGPSGWRGFPLRTGAIAAVLSGLIVGGVLSLITAVVVASFADLANQTSANGWITTLKCGQFRHGMLLRAACAADVGALNLPAEEVYWQAFLDGAHHRLNGRRRYILHFPPGGLPPNAASWSLTMGDARRFMVDNPIHRFSVGAKSGLAPNPDGSVDVYIQNQAPPGHESNWLPAPAGDFMLWLRVYQPGPAILDGSYRAPPVVETQ
jgi:hypothetical protein